jgi:hypothetical protein
MVPFLSSLWSPSSGAMCSSPTRWFLRFTWFSTQGHGVFSRIKEMARTLPLEPDIVLYPLAITVIGNSQNLVMGNSTD